jgi:hypothetical protein
MLIPWIRMSEPAVLRVQMLAVRVSDLEKDADGFALPWLSDLSVITVCQFRHIRREPPRCRSTGILVTSCRGPLFERFWSGESAGTQPDGVAFSVDIRDFSAGFPRGMVHNGYFGADRLIEAHLASTAFLSGVGNLAH